MFTVCIYLFASLVSVDPVSEDCVQATKKDVAEATAMCSALDKDPLTTCEIQRVGATKFFIRIRRIELSGPVEPATYPAPVKEQA